MTSANVRLIQDLFAGWERGDWSNLDWADPDIEMVRVDGIEPGTYRGREAVAQAWISWLGAWAGFSSTPVEFRDLGDRILVLVRFGGAGRASGLPMDDRLHATVLTIREGKVIRFELYFDHERALADLGL
jgi:ketosteroid isomerase-like protein